MNEIKKGSAALGIAIGFKRKYTARKISNVALDGTPYVQTTGNATERREVHIFCDTYAKRDATDNASNSGALLDVDWNGTTYRGYIEKDISWREWRDGHGVGAFTLIVSEVVE